MITTYYYPRPKKWLAYTAFDVNKLPKIIIKDDPWEIWQYFYNHNIIFRKNYYFDIGGHQCCGRIWKKKHNYTINIATNNPIFPYEASFRIQGYYISVVYDGGHELTQVTLWKPPGLDILIGKSDQYTLYKRIISSSDN